LVSDAAAFRLLVAARLSVHPRQPSMHVIHTTYTVVRNVTLNWNVCVHAVTEYVRRRQCMLQCACPPRIQRSHCAVVDGKCVYGALMCAHKAGPHATARGDRASMCVCTRTHTLVRCCSPSDFFVVVSVQHTQCNDRRLHPCTGATKRARKESKRHNHPCQ
jgi:hypothetical protein